MLTKNVPRGAAGGNWRALQHLQGKRQHLIPISVDKVGDRTEHDTAAVVGVDFLLIVGAAVNAPVQALTDNDAITDAPG